MSEGKLDRKAGTDKISLANLANKKNQPNKVIQLFPKKSNSEKIEDQLVADRETKLQNVASKSGISNQDFSDLIRRLDHEINNPLSIIVGAASLIKNLSKEGKFDPEQLESFTQMILGASSQISETLEDLKN